MYDWIYTRNHMLIKKIRHDKSLSGYGVII